MYSIAYYYFYYKAFDIVTVRFLQQLKKQYNNLIFMHIFILAKKYLCP